MYKLICKQDEEGAGTHEGRKKRGKEYESQGKEKTL